MILCCGGANAVPIGHTGRIFIFMPYFPNPSRILCTRILFRKMTNRFLYAKCFAFETVKDEQVLAKFSISSVDTEGAYKNLQAEMPGWNLMECVPMLRRNGMNACQRLQSKPIMKTSVPFLYGYVSCFPKSQSVY